MVVGGALSLLATPPAAFVLNHFVAPLVDFENLVRAPLAIFLGDGAIAVVASWRTGRYGRLEHIAD